MVLRHREILQRRGGIECLWVTKAPRAKRTRILLILNSTPNTATDRRWARWPVKNTCTPDNSFQYFKVWIGSWTLHFWSKLKDRQGKSPKRSQKERSWNTRHGFLMHDVMPLSCSSGNSTKMHLKCHLSIKRHTPNNKVSRLLYDSFIQS